MEAVLERAPARYTGRMDEKPKRRWIAFNLREIFLFVAVVALSFGWWTSNRRQEAEISSEYDGKVYTYHVWSSDLDPTPRWKTDAENPPFSAKKAMAAGVREIARIFGKENHDWMVERLILEPCDDDHWIWIVEFGPSPPFGGHPPRFRIVVLMNGTVLTPKIIDTLEKK